MTSEIEAAGRQLVLSERTQKLIESIDAKLNQRCGYQSDSVRRIVEDLQEFGRVEVGHRQACSHTDFTAHVWTGWQRVLKSLRKDGWELHEESVKHPNKSPTMAMGFWSSVVYTVTPTGAKEQ